MGVEIERKFLLLNDDWKLESNSSTSIIQGYLNSNKERTVRVRIRDNKGYLTIKGKTVDISRAEYEYEIPLNEAKELMVLCEKPIIEKCRYIIFRDGYTWEIDVFEGDNKGLIVAEVELESEEESFNIPEWIGKEVSDDPRYYNASLISNPFVHWKEK